MLVELVVTLTIAGAPPVEVTTDGYWPNWRQWPVYSRAPIPRHERCQARIDAAHVLQGKPVTNYLPLRCQSRADRRLKPDAAPTRRDR